MARLNKRVAIARSGVYVYAAGALPGLGLSVPPEKKDQRSFGVFRPPEVLKRAKDKFTKLPVTLEHPPRFVDGNNFRDFAMGYTGDTVDAELMADGHNVILCSTLTLADNESISAYYRGVVEVSPGYLGTFKWQDGVSPDGERYDIVMEDITEVNHLALTRRGRGGPSACVLDSREVIVTKRKSGLFYAIYKRLTGVKDSAEDGFVSTLADLIERNRKMSEDEIGQAVGRLSLQVDYLPDSEDKTVLSSYVSDLMGIKEESDEACKQAAIMIGNLYARLDKQVMSGVVADAYDEKDEAPANKDSNEETKGEPEEGESEAHEDKETTEQEKAEHDGATEPSSDTALDAPVVGPDDGIYDKKFDELTQQEKDFLWSELMELAKCHSLEEKAEVPEVKAPRPEEVKNEEGASEEEEPAQEDTADTKDEADKGESEVKDSLVDTSTEPRYPDTVSMATSAAKPSVYGIDISDMLSSMKHKGGR